MLKQQEFDLYKRIKYYIICLAHKHMCYNFKDMFHKTTPTHTEFILINIGRTS